ncbi:MAG: hypothetical protein MHM6MM_001114 [Cercozoa sp. M6MM]
MIAGMIASHVRVVTQKRCNDADDSRSGDLQFSDRRFVQLPLRLAWSVQELRLHSWIVMQKDDITLSRLPPSDLLAVASVDWEAESRRICVDQLPDLLSSSDTGARRIPPPRPRVLGDHEHTSRLVQGQSGQRSPCAAQQNTNADLVQLRKLTTRERDELKYCGRLSSPQFAGTLAESSSHLPERVLNRLRVWYCPALQRYYFDCECEKRRCSRNRCAIVAHACRHDRGDECLTCKECSKTFPSIKALNAHCKRHVNERRRQVEHGAIEHSDETAYLPEPTDCLPSLHT